MRLALALCALATGAAAEGCPTAADLAGGIRLEQASGQMTIVTRREGDELRVDSDIRFDGGGGQQTVAYYEHPLAMTHRTDSRDGPLAEYSRDPAELNDILSLREWSSDFRFLRNGMVQSLGTHTVRLTGLGDARFGDCSYTVWRVSSEIAFSDGTAFASERIFAPDLGIVVGETFYGTSGRVVNVLTFDQITAE